MSANPVNAWDTQVAVIPETTLGTTPAPASTSAYAGYMLEMIGLSLGPAEVGVIRAKQDRPVNRGPTNGYVEGRVMPIEWSLDTSIKSRAAVDTASHLLSLLKAAGLVHTVNAGSNVTITPSQQPLESGAFAGVSLVGWKGSGLAVHHAETLRGCVVRSIRIEGGAQELMAKFAGVGIGKTTALSQAGVQGRIDSITLANNSVTSLTITAEESYRLAPGYYLCESEIILVTACTPGGTSATITRGALGSTAAGHTAQPLTPYKPSPTFTGSPIAEAVSTLTVGGVAVRARNWSFDLTTGMDLLEPETGSRYSQGAMYKRYDIKARAQLVLSGDQVSMLGKATARPNVAIAIVQGTGTGGISTINLPYAEVMPFAAPDTANDVAVVDVEFRIREAADGTNAFNIVLT